MSEEINLESSNLCIPEDAFDQFQANTTYEEEEFITLSDIVSPGPVVPELPSDISEIPYENEVVLASNVDDQHLDETRDTYETDAATVSAENDSYNIQQASQQATEQNNQKLQPVRKRGRKKKSFIENSVTQSTENGITSQDNEVDGNQVEKSDTPTLISKRGRKIKHKVLAQNEFDYLSPKIVKNQTPESTKRGRKRLSDDLQTETILESHDIVNQAPRKRGRRKKSSVIENEAILTPSDQPAHERDLTDDLNDSNVADNTLPMKTSRRRGRPKKKTLQEPEKQLSGDDILVNDSSNSTVKKERRRPGRPKKILQENTITADQPQAELHFNNTTTTDDDDLPLKTCSSQSLNDEIQQDTIDASNTVTSEANTENHQPGEFDSSDEDADKVSLSKLRALKTLDSNKDSLNNENEKNNISYIDIIISPENELAPQDKNEVNSLKDEKPILDENGDIDTGNNSLLVEDTSKRPTRIKSKKIMHYDDDESEEDPFANVELSEDEDSGGRRKGKRNYSDDEYIPQTDTKKKCAGKYWLESDSEISGISDIEKELEETYRRKKTRSAKKEKQTKSPKKKSKNDKEASQVNVTSVPPTITIDQDDVEDCLKSSIIQANDNSNNSDDNLKKPTWGKSNEFENFIAQKIQGTSCQIKKVSSNRTSNSTPLEIPVLSGVKKFVEMSSQTNVPKLSTKGVQTVVPSEVPMENNVALTAEQSQKACEFLTSIVKTTSELGQLMTQKSDDFITKKINTANVTDTFKMDYCVRKSFLLLKLAKHNIIQMEEDLSKQYEEFLKKTNLINHRKEVKTITPTEKDNDSDCEIVEEPGPSKPEKPKFNPKTVFLNKELSIKIAKKPVTQPQEPTCKKKLEIKGNRQTVWISDSVMMKKVNPNQSFLAQDGRNKKPPDCHVTEKMVSDFFKEYYHKQASSICAPFTSVEWLSTQRIYECRYFVVENDKFPSPSVSFPESNDIYLTNSANKDNSNALNERENILNPETLFSLCTKALKSHMEMLNFDVEDNYAFSDNNADSKQNQTPSTLFRLCINVLSTPNDISPSNSNFKLNMPNEVLSLKTLCCKKIAKLLPLPYRKKKLPQILDISNTETVPILNPESCKCAEDGDAVSNHYISLQEEELNYEDGKFVVSSLKKLCHNKCIQLLYMQPRKKELFQIDNSFKFDSCNDHYLPKDELKKNIPAKPMDLKTLCCAKITEYFTNYYRETEETKMEDDLHTDKLKKPVTCSYIISDDNDVMSNSIFIPSSETKNGLKSLLLLCLEYIQRELPLICTKNLDDHENYSDNILPIIKEVVQLHEPESLKHITLKIIKQQLYKDVIDNFEEKLIVTPEVVTTRTVKRLANICYDIISIYTSNGCENVTELEETTPSMTINSVNTLSEEAFHNMEGDNGDDEDTSYYDDDNYDGDFNNLEGMEENSWVSQVKLKELKSCFEPSKPSDRSNSKINEEDSVFLEEPIIAQIKLEPLEELTDNLIDTIVKTEPVQHFDEMTMIPENVVTKQENIDNTDIVSARVPLQRQDSASFDESSFESFVRHNKMMHNLDEPNDEIFSQSGQRVRRQHEPDYANEYDPSMSLLIPQTFEPMAVESAKGILMESSSDDESNSKKASGRKKIDRRKKNNKKIKQSDGKQHSKETTKEKISEKPALSVPDLNEVATLTRRMRERIRQEEKKVNSSDSDNENLPLSTRKDKEHKKNKTSNSNKPVEDEIQCNNVDSTEQIENINDSPGNDLNFTGFSAVDQNEICSYQKYVKYVYDKILPKVTAEDKKKAEDAPECSTNVADDDDRPESPLINYEDPVEMLECEPTMPIFDENVETKPTKKSTSKTKQKSDNKGKELKPVQKLSFEDNSSRPLEDKVIYTERHGWKCYPINVNEKKLYQKPAIILEKLPESFVETYFMYQNITDRNKEDDEVDRLINLNSLNRASFKESKKGKAKVKVTTDGQLDKATDGRPESPNSDNCAELTASEDEGANVHDEIPPPVPKQNTENSMAKNLLMDDSDSEEVLSKIKQEQVESHESTSKTRSKTKADEQKTDHPESLMLTADKMMNKELNLLHAPVVLNNESPVKEEKETTSKNKHKSGSKRRSSRDRIKNEEDSSSEEEKQWVSTKEKLLKRMGKKQDTTSVDDAKRAKLVTEFIERRGDAPESRKRGRGGRRNRRSSRKMLEREKQMRVLQHELLGTPVDPAYSGPRHSQSSYFKGRRNIRKVIDKKSLARSTVVANMEEFERKCRLNQRQARLRELLGVEEAVNVLVINDEVCLEYGFEEQRPLVAVHPFFTKVMKAHQYEGVKFMWDACFESLEKVESGHGGGGCILAHCMGLGKTLQVLALLHTVLTHPRVGMRRVLVCCPLSTVLNWVDEIHKWIGPVTDQIKVFELSKLKKTYERAYQLEDWYNEGGIFIIGYELFRSLTTLDPELDDIRPTIVNKIRMALLDPGPDIIVCDEGHLLKNDCSVLAIAMSRVVTKRRIVLTGTPMQNNLREYYCMVNFVKPNLLGTYSEYSNRFENPIMNGQHRDSQEEDIKLMKQRTHILHKVLEGCLQRQEASVLYPYLPKKHEYTVFISLTTVQWDLYKHYIKNVESCASNKQSILRDFHILQKIWSHPHVLHNFQVRSRDINVKTEKLEDDLAREDLAASEDIKPGYTDTWWLQYLDGGSRLDSLESSNKFLVVFRILDECIQLEDKVLLFSTSLITLDSLEYFLKKINKWSLGQEYYRLDGSVPAEVRQKWCREFNAEHNRKTKLFLISTRAGSLGLNMVAANRVILFDTSWNPAHDIQSIFRVYRFGQKKDCYIYRLVALGTMEQKIYERSVTKQAVACRVVDEQQIDRHYNMAELTELYKYDEAGVGVAGGVAVGVCDVALLRVARGVAALHAVHEHDSLLRGSSERALPEHERNAAWMQFQQEQHTKQMQNHLTSSVSYASLIKSYEGPSNTHPPEVKAVNTDEKPPQPSAPKGKKGKKTAGAKVTIPVKVTSGPSKEAETIEEEMVKKIMNLLICHNFQNRQKPSEISELVGTVRKMVAFGKMPKNAFNGELAKSIADVLLMKEAPKIPPPKTIGRPVKRKRGRPRKDSSDLLSFPTKEPDPPQPSTSQPSTSQPSTSQPSTSQPSTSQPSTSQPSTSQEFEYMGRRKAAVNAEIQMQNSVIDLDDDWRADSPAWEPDNVPATKFTRDIKTETPPPEPVEKPTIPMNLESIELSDDEAPVKQAKPKPKTTEPKKIKEEVIPLHPSLLSNTNFIKIVAHTYLSGNPMLDEDAATLAAQYSTLRAKKDLETTGKDIVSGPIYDIAVKVLGIDILKKLHKANPTKSVEKIIATEASQEAKKTAARNTNLQVTAAGSAELKSTPASNTPAAPSVVPVGLINRTGSLTANESFVPQQAKEESILPDDDDVIANDPPPSVAAKSIFTKTAKPIVIKAINSKLIPTVSAANRLPSAKPAIPKLVISAGKLVPQPQITSTPPFIPQAPITAPVPTEVISQDSTICLDSDEDETITPNVAPPPVKSKRVALKSTTKLPAMPALTPAPAPVPVSLMVAEPHPNLIPLHQPAASPAPQHPNMLSNAYLVIPASQLNRVPDVSTMSVAQCISSPQRPQRTQSPLNTLLPQNTKTSQPLLQSHLLTNTFKNLKAKQKLANISSTPVPVPSTSATTPKKTVCRPGDILRVSKTGKLEIINREDDNDDVAVLEDKETAEVKSNSNKPSNKIKITIEKNKTSSTNKPTKTYSINRSNTTRLQESTNQPSQQPATPVNVTTPSKTIKPTLTTDKTSRVRTMSISSSSSNNSRPSSPEVQESEADPLSILKDVVHIQAADFSDKPTTSTKIKPAKTNQQKPTTKNQTKIGSTFITKSNSNIAAPKSIGNVSITKTKTYPAANSTPSRSSTPAKPTSKMTQSDITAQIAKTDTILKKLDKMLGPSPNKPSQKTTSTFNKNMKSSTSSKVVDMIDLASYDNQATSTKPKKTITIEKLDQEGRKTVKTLTKMDNLNKIVGTSKNIIINNIGKAQANSGHKIQITNVETLTPSWSESKKRSAPAAEPSTSKKKKTEPMTLKDFNIDDIDDIIELE